MTDIANNPVPPVTGAAPVQQPSAPERRRDVAVAPAGEAARADQVELRPARRGHLRHTDAIKFTADERAARVQACLDELAPALGKETLTVPERDAALATLGRARAAGVLPEVAARLDHDGALKPLYGKMHESLAGVTVLTLLTGGLLTLPAAVETAKMERGPEFLQLLRDGGVEPRLVDALQERR